MTADKVYGRFQLRCVLAAMEDMVAAPTGGRQRAVEGMIAAGTLAEDGLRLGQGVAQLFRLGKQAACERRSVLGDKFAGNQTGRSYGSGSHRAEPEKLDLERKLVEGTPVGGRRLTLQPAFQLFPGLTESQNQVLHDLLTAPIVHGGAG